MNLDFVAKRYLSRILDRVFDEYNRRTETDRAARDRAVVERVAYVIELDRILSSSPSTDPYALFRGVPDEFWLWLHTEGLRLNGALRAVLPGLPPTEYQIGVASTSGDETLRRGFAVYELYRRLIERHHGPLHACSAVLDFGCGWGRILRFFLKDIEASRLFGIDAWHDQIHQAKRINRWGNFAVTDALPPTAFADDTFDVVFSFSVFSHVGEERQNRWLAEFRRILRPGGLLIASTWGVEQIDFLEQVRRGAARTLDPIYNERIPKRFAGRDKALADYARGTFGHVDIGYGDYTDYGETWISKRYVMNEWSRQFKVLDYIDDRAACTQNVIVVQK